MVVSLPVRNLSLPVRDLWKWWCPCPCGISDFFEMLDLTDRTQMFFETLDLTCRKQMFFEMLDFFNLSETDVFRNA